MKQVIDMPETQHTSPVQYRETQKFTQWWLILIIGGSAALVLYGFFIQIVLGKPFGDHPEPDWLLVLVTAVVGVGMPLWFFTLKLVIEVRGDGLWYKFVGLNLRWHQIRWGEIMHFYAREYKALREYGGWGIRLGFSGKAYNVKGNQGLQLVLRNGHRFLLGSQNPDRLVQAIESVSGHSRSQPS